MMRKTAVCLSLILVFPVIYANGLPGNAELVLENIQIEPAYPKKGELVSITAHIHNAGIVDTKSLASIISVAYFVDGELLFIDWVDNVKPGISNKFKISSGPIWSAERGDHVIKIIVDYHNTLRDQYDSPSDNIAEKTLSIKFRDSTEVLLDTSPQYVVEGEYTLLTINASARNLDTKGSISNQKMILSLNGEDMQLTTDKNGKVSFSKTIVSLKPVEVKAYFEGSPMHLPSNSSRIVPVIPDNVTSSIIMKTTEINKQYNFRDHSFEFLVYQDSYDTLFKKFSPNLTQESDTFLIPLPANHHYFTEVYIDGRIFLVTDEKQLNEGDIFVEKLTIPESAEIRFRIINETGESQNNATLKAWIHSTTTDERGFTDWLRFIPTFDKPYIAVVSSDQKTIKSYPFHVFAEEKKTINIVMKEISSESEIPQWVKSNAGWWAEGLIGDSDFVSGIQYLISKGIMTIPPTQSSESSAQEIPDGVKNNAGWWADGSISDESFIQGIQYLIKEGIIKKE